MAERVVVHSIEELEGYCSTLITLKSDIEVKANELKALSASLQEITGKINSATEHQGSNWQDPQYYKLKENLAPITDAVKSTSSEAENTAKIVNNQAACIDDSISYIKRLIAHLKETV